MPVNRNVGLILHGPENVDETSWIRVDAYVRRHLTWIRITQLVVREVLLEDPQNHFIF
jgi:hypothetical protein